MIRLKFMLKLVMVEMGVFFFDGKFMLNLVVWMVVMGDVGVMFMWKLWKVLICLLIIVINSIILLNVVVMVWVSSDMDVVV